MAEFRVTFFNNLINSKGMPFKCLQRAVIVGGVKDADNALQKAKREFERLENIPNWKYRAQFLEVEVVEIAAKRQSPIAKLRHPGPQFTRPEEVKALI
jgi:hypothetical protein